MRHVVKSVLAGFGNMHAGGLVRADLQPAHILLRGAGRFQGGAWLRQLDALAASAGASAQRPMVAAAARTEALLSYHAPQSFQVRADRRQSPTVPGSTGVREPMRY